MTTPTPDGSGTKPSIVLIGFRGCGKSTVGRRLADLVGGGYVDTDDMIVEHAGRSIAVLFEEEGEVGFRQLEHDAVARVAAEKPAVISVGGGALLDARNTELLHSAGSLVWLTAPAKVLWERIQTDPSTPGTRPALTHLAGLDEVRQLLVEREPFYEAAADLVVDAADRDPDEIAKEIVERLALDG